MAPDLRRAPLSPGRLTRRLAPSRSEWRGRRADGGGYARRRRPQPFMSGPRPAGLGAVRGVHRHELVRAFGPVAQEWPRVARVDDLLDPEALGRAERRAHRVQALGYLRQESLGIL